MIKIKKIEILNYKSIKELTIPFDDDYGRSKAVFLLGINESGKSNILDAIRQIDERFAGMKFDDVCHKSVQDDEGACVEISMHVEIKNIQCIDGLLEMIVERFECFKDHADSLTITKCPVMSVRLKRDAEPEICLEFNIDIGGKFPFNRWHVDGDNIVLNDRGSASSSASTKSEIKEKLDEFTNTKLYLIADHLPKIVYWKSNERFLINKPISLSQYKGDMTVSEPLTNMFYIYGTTDHAGIVQSIDRALGNDEKKSELQDGLATKVTSHINEIWEEHNVRIKIVIDGDILKVHVEDKDSKLKYYNMMQRSDGFKQFISLLLSLSSQYKGGMLKNNIILLDEPETHLHPSGIKFMRDEILKIGKDNHVFVATHSPSMVDFEHIERHWLVSKTGMETTLGKDSNILDEDVMKIAFGISILNDILPRNLLLVEGSSDKKLLEYAMGINCNGKKIPEIKILSAGGASKLLPMAALCNREGVKVHIMCDSDKCGNKAAHKIKGELGSSFDNSNVFCLRDLEQKLPKNATIEDALPRDFVTTHLEEMEYKIASNGENISILHQLIRGSPILKGDKKKQAGIKKEIVDAFIQKGIKEGYIFSIAKKLVDKINER